MPAAVHIHMVFASDVRMLLGRPRTRVWRPSRTRVRCGEARRPSPTTLRHSGRRVLHGTNSNSSNRLRRWPCDKTRCVLRACRRRPIRLVGVPLSCALRREACTLGRSALRASLPRRAGRTTRRWKRTDEILSFCSTTFLCSTSFLSLDYPPQRSATLALSRETTD